jgi:hypothetical protein
MAKDCKKDIGALQIGKALFGADNRCQLIVVG